MTEARTWRCTGWQAPTGAWHGSISSPSGCLVWTCGCKPPHRNWAEARQCAEREWWLGEPIPDADPRDQIAKYPPAPESVFEPERPPPEQMGLLLDAPPDAEARALEIQRGIDQQRRATNKRRREQAAQRLKEQWG